ncbi:DUF3052 domain-containing protein [Glutamicibacter creatinolyticus]|uniref:DUF3052 domain-containing protein n=1 Tax=Glutamicibacter creatinolyticus TaxID=162496 RepID=A0A5B7WSK7_9MICC|nr:MULTISPECIES: DUF3052 domain-containing protein [Micrococcaceae]QCY47038.1 hypothetical protein GcLGCM259_1304 [Glutamicibacter creatinolyticus]TLK56271.1 DUF3052 domain-containing protein [Glutamicibacter sp. V16R2B1]
MSDAVSASVEPAKKMGFKEEDLIQELGYDDDVDYDLRDSIEDLIGSELLTEEDHDVVDAVIYWWRDGDGDLADALMDALASLEDDGVVWLLTPKQGREGHVSPTLVQQDAPTAGLHMTNAEGVSKEWSAIRLVQRRKH